MWLRLVNLFSGHFFHLGLDNISNMRIVALDDFGEQGGYQWICGTLMRVFVQCRNQMLVRSSSQLSLHHQLNGPKLFAGRGSCDISPRLIQLFFLWVWIHLALKDWVDAINRVVEYSVRASLTINYGRMLKWQLGWKDLVPRYWIVIARPLKCNESTNDKNTRNIRNIVSSDSMKYSALIKAVSDILKHGVGAKWARTDRTRWTYAFQWVVRDNHQSSWRRKFIKEDDDNEPAWHGLMI